MGRTRERMSALMPARRFALGQSHTGAVPGARHRSIEIAKHGFAQVSAASAAADAARYLLDFVADFRRFLMASTALDARDGCGHAAFWALHARASGTKRVAYRRAADRLRRRLVRLPLVQESAAAYRGSAGEIRGAIPGRTRLYRHADRDPPA